VRVLSVNPDGSRSVVSHFNKHTKGLLARALATTPAAVRTRDDVAEVAAAAGLTPELHGDSTVDVLLYEPPPGTPAAKRTEAKRLH
jgi:hypothetical protein